MSADPLPPHHDDQPCGDPLPYDALPYGHRPFHGAKLLLTCGDALLCYLRDDRPDIPFPGCWDLPGGGREGAEPPIACALRELHEEFGLRLPATRLTGRAFASHQAPAMISWLFRGTVSGAEIAQIRFGTEGQFWRMMPVARYLTHPRGVPHFQRWIAAAARWS